MLKTKIYRCDPTQSSKKTRVFCEREPPVHTDKILVKHPATLPTPRDPLESRVETKKSLSALRVHYLFRCQVESSNARRLGEPSFK